MFPDHLVAQGQLQSLLLRCLWGHRLRRLCWTCFGAWMSKPCLDAPLALGIW